MVPGPRSSVLSLGAGLAAIATLVGLSTLTSAQAPDILATSMRAMGASNLESIQYSGSGSSFTVGQAPGPGAPPMLPPRRNHPPPHPASRPHTHPTARKPEA